MYLVRLLLLFDIHMNNIRQIQAKLRHAVATSERVSWDFVLQSLQEGKRARRASWMYLEDTGTGVLNSGPPAIRSRWFEGLDGEAHLCFVNSAGDHHPAFPYSPTVDDKIATDWIILNEDLLS